MNTPTTPRPNSPRSSQCLSFKHLTTGAIAAFVLALLPAPAFSVGLLLPAVQKAMVMQIDGVPGESELLSGAIDIQSFSNGISFEGGLETGAGGGAGTVVVSDINITKNIDKATPILMQQCATGKHFPKVTIYLRKTDSERLQYLAVVLENVQITSYQVHTSTSNSTGEESADLSEESITLKFDKISETVLGSGDPVTFMWDLRLNTLL